MLMVFLGQARGRPT